MSDEIIIGLDELSTLFTGETLLLDEDDHEVITNDDDSVTVIVDPESTQIVETGDFSIGNSLSEDIYLRLGSFGYDDISEHDKRILMYILAKVKQTVLNFTHLTEIPDGLHFQIVEAVCGEFLKAKFAMGKIKIELATTTFPVASIKEGDTTVTYSSVKESSNTTPTAVFLKALEKLELSKSELCRYRRLAW